MPIDSTHADYATLTKRAKRARDAIAGQEAVHAATTEYLPALSEQTEAEYKAYLTRTGWYGATGRTHDGLVGMVFRRPPTIEAPPGFDAVLEDVDLAGESLDGFARKVFGEMLATSRVGVLVEYPSVQAQPQTVAQAQASNLRPYATMYAVESIINWRVERVANAMRITMLVLHEVVCEVNPADVYGTAEIEQWRALLLEDGRYVQRIYRKGSKGSDGKQQVEQFGPDIVPLMNGAPLPAIPFVVFGPNSNDLTLQQPPLQQLADVNFGHYRNTADLEHGAHFAGLPTPWVTGHQAQEGEKIAIGSPTMLVFASPDATVGMLEFTGTGLGALEKRCEVKEAHMAALGARMLAPEKAGVEAGATLSMRHTGESSVLAGMANLCSAGMQVVLRTMAEWMGAAGEIKYQLSTDFMPAGLTAPELTALVAAWQSGAISWETFFANLKRGEIIDGQTTPEDERERIDSAGPTPSQQQADAALKAAETQADKKPGGGNADDE
jgi:hypothetical protein